MLIVAFPKSMSSSLKRYIAKKRGIHSEYRLPELPSVGPLWHWFRRFTNASVQFDEVTAKKLCDSKDTIWKFHIPPTLQNLDTFSPLKKVVLLRDPKEAIYSWRRTALKAGRSLKGLPFNKSFLSLSEEDWVKKAELSGLLLELERFHQGWKRHTSNVLHISYNKLLNNPKKTVNKVEEFFGLPITKKVVLPKSRYTRS